MHLGGDEAIGAFAEYIAVVSDIWKAASPLQRLFAEFEQISALGLRVKKNGNGTVVGHKQSPERKEHHAGALR